MTDDPQKSPAPTGAAGDWPHGERREVPRYLFIANAEETDLDSGTKLTARVSELSRKGCYLDTLNPFPKGTRIKLYITHEHASFTAFGTVIYQQPNMGMGIIFNTVEPAQMEVLQKWLTEMGDK